MENNNKVIAQHTNKRGERMVVKAYLHYIKGNRAPYFSLTCDLYDGRGRDIGGGAAHDEILKIFPRFSDLAKFHLRDIDGMPSYPIENGYYWLSGAVGGLGQEYHGASGKSGKSPEKCLEIFAEHLLVNIEDAAQIAQDVADTYNRALNYFAGEFEGALERGAEFHIDADTTKLFRQEATKYAQEKLSEIIKSHAARWAQEARAIIEKYSLEIYNN